MSFAGEVRRELKDHISRATHCRKAELAGMYEGCLKNIPEGVTSDPKNELLIFSENLTIQEKCINLVKKAYREQAEVIKIGTHTAVAVRSENIREILSSRELLSRDCCKRAYLRGWFLASGTVSDPSTHYNLEIVTSDREQALHISEILGEYDIAGKIHTRKGNFVVYIHEGQKIVDLLGLIGAHTALMNFENARIVKEVRAGVNRAVNCETANIRKTISASSRQIEDIEYIRDNYGFDKLPESLAEIAKLRLEFPESSLTELGEKLKTPIGKSGVNHRLRRLGELSEQLRDGGK